MKLKKDQNNLLVIENINIQQDKEYSYNVGGYSFSSYDKGIIVYHKKQFKIINLKNLGDKMGVFYIINFKKNCHSRKSGNSYKEQDCLNRFLPSQEGQCGCENNIKIDNNSLHQGLLFFQGFNEQSGKRYSFLPKFPLKNLDKLNKNLKTLGSDVIFSKESLGITSTSFEENIVFENIEGTYSFLFGLLLAHGKLNIKNGMLNSAQIQLPLLGMYKNKIELFQNILKEYSQKGIFVKMNILENQDGIILQLSITDYELLGIFANFYKDIEKIDGITKYKQALKIKEELIEYLKINLQIPADGKDEVIKIIENGKIKLLN